MPVAKSKIHPSAAKGAGLHSQQRLSFKKKVTKAIQTGKPEYKSPARTQEYVPQPSSESEVKQPGDDASTPAPGEEHDRSPPEAEVQAQPDAQDNSDVESQARKLNDNDIERYWDRIEASRSAKAVHRKHTEGLTTGDNVLRYFDVSSQYGPCIGISRTERWLRAYRLGLNPPLEVLAVLLKEDARENKGIERAHMDEILNSTAVGSVGV